MAKIVKSEPLAVLDVHSGTYFILRGKRVFDFPIHQEGEYRSKLGSAGFEQIDLEPTRIYRIEDAREFLSGQNIDVDAIAPQVDGKFMSAFVRAVKPQQSCCGPICCN
jgi:hypothetical protein